MFAHFCHKNVVVIHIFLHIDALGGTLQATFILCTYLNWATTIFFAWFVVQEFLSKGRVWRFSPPLGCQDEVVDQSACVIISYTIINYPICILQRATEWESDTLTAASYVKSKMRVKVRKEFYAKFYAQFLDKYLLANQYWSSILQLVQILPIHYQYWFYISFIL